MASRSSPSSRGRRLLPLLLVLITPFVNGTSHLSLRYVKPPQEFKSNNERVPRVPGIFPGGFPFGGGVGGAPPQAPPPPQFNVTFVEDPSGDNEDPSVSQTLETIVQIIRMIAELASLFGMGNATELLGLLAMLVASFVITATLMIPLLVMMPLGLLIMAFAFLPIPLRNNNPFALGRSLQPTWKHNCLHDYSHLIQNLSNPPTATPPIKHSGLKSHSRRKRRKNTNNR